MSDAFNIAVKTLTTIAGDVLVTVALHEPLKSEGVKFDDWKKLQKMGQEAEAADEEQKASTRRLSIEQETLNQTLAIVDKGIRDIKIRVKAILLDLKQDAAATADDKAFVQGFSFSVPAPRKKGEESTEQRKRDSTAQEALKLQINRMVDGISKHAAVSKAFAARALSAEILAGLKQAADDLPVQQQARDAAYDTWLAAGAKERHAVSTQNEIWDSIRVGVARVAKTNTAVKQLLDRLAAARQQAKTGKPRKKSNPVISSEASTSQKKNDT